ncbi:hypothetical protein CDL15_Pgr009619 [Punica granatum]|nr:hypothetical protein CDL15_Pgr009619 [Punica granatum]
MEHIQPKLDRDGPRVCRHARDQTYRSSGSPTPKDQSAIMYAYLRAGLVKRDIQQDDVNGIRALYPSK